MHVYKPPPVGGLDRVPVFTAGTGSTRADLFELDGVTPMPDNVLVADTHGNLPSFQCATAPVYVGVSGSRTTWAPSESGEPSAASSALSATHVAQVSTSSGASLAAGALSVVSFAGATIYSGDAATGDGTGTTSLPLAVTVVGGNVQLPDDDAIYDMHLRVELVCDVADAGKQVSARLSSPSLFSDGPPATVPADGVTNLTADHVEWLVGGNGPGPCVARVDLTALTAPATVFFADLWALKR